MSGAREVNIDGLVGPTHNFAGLSLGNRASMGNAGSTSNPKRAALQGLAKMRHLHQRGVPQGVMPPQQRPDPDVLVQLGFRADATMLDVARATPHLVPVLSSASAMWAANAATVTPSIDSADGRVHFTPANLSSTTHRSFEHRQTERILAAMFDDRDRFVVHAALPAALPFADEGAANHGRLCSTHDAPGTHVFVFGRDEDDPSSTTSFPRRQTRLAGELISASHGQGDRVLRVRQSGAAIDAGAFHNDVVSVINERVLFTHADAFDDPSDVYRQLRAALAEVEIVEVPAAEVSLSDAIASYLFNSQLVTMPDRSMVLIAPAEVREIASTRDYLDAAVADPEHPIAAVTTLDVRESMRNGGGPACLRLRVVMTEGELASIRDRVLVDDSRLDALEAWVERHYRDELTVDDLADPALADETNRALDELTGMLHLGSIYPFQR